MPGISFCPNCGASVEGEKNKCQCCGAILDETQNNQNQGSVPPQYSNQFGQQGFGQIPPQPLQYENYNPYSQNDGAYNGCAITGMILGILSIVICCLQWLTAILGIVGIVLSIIGLKSYRYKGCATAGLVCSIAGTLLSLLFMISIVM